MAAAGALSGLSAADARRLARARPDGLEADARGLFRDESWVRRVSGEPALLVSGGCALLLEVAHPLVAAGVAEHSDFRSDPMGRLQRTLDAMNAIVFGDLRAALAAAGRVERAHERVRGALARAAGRFPAGTAYAGRDPELVLWVWGTLLETAVRAYTRFVAPLDEPARDATVAGYAVVARLLGAPPERVPERWAPFRTWFDGVVERDLTVTDTAREIAAFVLDPPAGAPGAGTLRAVTASLLPPPVREQFGLRWEAADERRLDAFARSVRSLRAAHPPAPDA